MLVDTHIHLDFEDFAKDLDEVLKRAHQAGVCYFLNIGTELASVKKSLALASQKENIFCSLGWHPHQAKYFEETAWEELKNLLRDKKVVALGEVGLDFYRNLSPRQAQEKVFLKFINLHKETELPLILHVRNAFQEVLKILEDHLKPPLRGVMHCFSADRKVLQEALQLGLYVSFTGQITYPKNEELLNLTAEVPDEKLLLETDAPFLPPSSQRGKRNEPAWLVESAELIAQKRNITLEDLARITGQNCNKLFGFPEFDQSPKLAYKIRNSLYLNLTNSCTNACQFCIRFYDDYVKGHNLRLALEPSAEDLLQAVKESPPPFKEVVFCGYGEPLLRWEVVKKVAQELKKKGFYLRLNTNGQGNLIAGRNILPEFKGLIDKISISLNAQDEDTYQRICQPKFSGSVYQQVKQFILEAKKQIPQVEVTAIDYPGFDIQAVKKITEEELGVKFRLRHYNRVG